LQKKIKLLQQKNYRPEVIIMDEFQSSLETSTTQNMRDY